MLEEPALSDVLVPFVRAFAGGGAGEVRTLVGDASTRRYHRVRIQGGGPPSAVVMELPPEPLKSDEATAGDLPPELPFLNMQSYLAAGGIPVPQVYRADMRLGLVALEDLGDVTFEAAVVAATPNARRALYRSALDQIVALQALGAERPDPRCVAFARRFDEKLLRWELDHFREWFLEAERGVRLEGGDAAIVAAAFDWLARELAAAPPVLVHRDFQSRNLMLAGSGGTGTSAAVDSHSHSPGAPALRVIDFQDALLGSRAYDLVALLRDSYVELPLDEVAELVDAFIVRARVSDGDGFRRLFVLQTLQRKLKDTGRFVFIDRVRGNPSFLRWIPTSLRYVREALAAAPAPLGGLRDVLGRAVPELTA
jgi:aminoglycoside/choline kinase family phosphotransferase